MTVHQLGQLRLRQPADALVYHLTAFEDQQRWNAADAVAHCGCLVFIGVQLAVKNKMDYALSVILNSSLQVALCLTPILVLLSYFVSNTHLSLVLSPLLVAALAITTLISAMIVYDGESNWMEGIALIGLYCIIAAAFWWG